MTFPVELPKWAHPDFSSPRVKPTGAVEVDWNNPITKDMVLLANFGELGKEKSGTSDTTSPPDVPGVTFLHNRVGAVFQGRSAGSEGFVKYSNEGSHLAASSGGGLTLETGWDDFWLTDEEVTWFVRFRRNSTSNQSLCDFDATSTTHYPFGGDMFMGIFRTARLTLTGVYDAALDDTFHNVVVTNSLSKDEYKTYTGGVERDSTTTAFGVPSTASKAELLFLPAATSLKDVQFFGLWKRALNAQEILSLEQNPNQLMKPVLPLHAFFNLDVAAPSGRIMGSIAGQGGLAGRGGIAGPGGGIAG